MALLAVFLQRGVDLIGRCLVAHGGAGHVGQADFRLAHPVRHVRTGEIHLLIRGCDCFADVAAGFQSRLQLLRSFLGLLLAANEGAQCGPGHCQGDAPRAAKQAHDTAADRLETSRLQLGLAGGGSESINLFGSAHRGRLEHLECGLRGSERRLDALNRIDGQTDVVGHRAGAAVEIACGLMHRAEHAGQ